MIQFMSRSFTAPAAFCAMSPGKVRPRPATAPACKKSRRVRPSQNETGRSASNRNMALSQFADPDRLKRIHEPIGKGGNVRSDDSPVPLFAGPGWLDLQLIW